MVSGGRVWKELTLNSTTDQSKYRVWDYPIKEQYTHILQVIDNSGTLESSAKGFQRVSGKEMCWGRRSLRVNLRKEETKGTVQGMLELSGKPSKR